MAFNPRPEDVSSRSKDLPPAPVSKRPKYEYFVEWWRLGTDERDIEAGQFRTSDIKHFVKMFGRFKHLSMVFLRRCHDDKVLLDRRVGSRQV